MDISENQTNLITNEQRQYILLPASTENPRNISSEPMAHPPPFMSSVQEMRERYLARKEKHGGEEKSMGGGHEKTSAKLENGKQKHLWK